MVFSVRRDSLDIFSMISALPDVLILLRSQASYSLRVADAAHWHGFESNVTMAAARARREAFADGAAQGDKGGSPDCLLVHGASVA
jgi:hypothetical protein